MTGIPEAVRAEVEASLRSGPGPTPRINDVRAIGGGCISQAVTVRLEGGASYFLKWNEEAAPDLFEAEADGLRALAVAAPDSLRVPRVLGPGEGQASNGSWLLLELVDAAPTDGDFGARLARGLTRLHREIPTPPEGPAPFGWARDNFIGSLPQDNSTASDWGRFWRDRRILPQLQSARAGGHLTGPAGDTLDRLVDVITTGLDASAGVEPSLLHGDLWGGNVFCATDGRPVLIDPAVYVGHHEVDLAMSELFGFAAGFQGAYREAADVGPGYEAYRRDLYQLYYLLVHLNLFGPSYEASCTRAAQRVLAAL